MAQYLPYITNIYINKGLHVSGSIVSYWENRHPS